MHIIEMVKKEYTATISFSQRSLVFYSFTKKIPTITSKKKFHVKPIYHVCNV